MAKKRLTIVFEGEVLLVGTRANVLERQFAEPTLAQPHRREELCSVLELLLLALFVPVELLGHDVDHGRERLERRLRVEERQARAARDHVDRRRGVLAAARPRHLGVDVRVHGVDALAVHGEAETGLRCHRANAPSSVSVRFRKVSRDIRLFA